MLDAATTPQIVRLADYRPPAWQVPDIELDFQLDEAKTQVTARLTVERNGRHDEPLVLDGEGPKLVALSVDGKPLDAADYRYVDDKLTIALPGDAHVVESVVEIAPRILARVCNGEISALIHESHRARGVDIRVGATVSAVRELPDGRLAVDTGSGDTIAADLIVVGTGVAPDDRLAKAAGLATQDGIIVNDHARTNDAAIFAAGDCTRFPGPHGPVRLENWRHAQEHGAIAGRNATGGDFVYKVAPSFWSEQHDMYIQGVGWPVAHPSARVRRPLAAGAVLMFELDGPRLAHALGINAQRDMAMARRLIERGVPVDASELADAAKPLAAMLKAKV